MQRKAIGMLATAGALAAMATTAAACENCKKGYVFGQPTAIGNGMAFTWAKFNKDTKKLESIGITLTESALEGLPSVKELKGPEPMMMWQVDLPKEVKGFPFDHVEIDWNPVGHPPAEIYGKPHFDFHFYTIDRKTQAAITTIGADKKRCELKPEASFVPPGYILPPDTIVPQMGAHWINPGTSPELSGKPFTTTFLYGSYNGKTAFWEPMITTEFLSSKPNFTQPIENPKRFDTAGYYPTSYSVKHNAERHEISIALDGLVMRQGALAAKAAVRSKR